MAPLVNLAFLDVKVGGAALPLKEDKRLESFNMCAFQLLDEVVLDGVLFLLLQLLEFKRLHAVLTLGNVALS
jgi:hypothetical protein